MSEAESFQPAAEQPLRPLLEMLIQPNETTDELFRIVKVVVPDAAPLPSSVETEVWNEAETPLSLKLDARDMKTSDSRTPPLTPSNSGVLPPVAAAATEYSIALDTPKKTHKKTKKHTHSSSRRESKRADPPPSAYEEFNPPAPAAATPSASSYETYDPPPPTKNQKSDKKTKKTPKPAEQPLPSAYEDFGVTPKPISPKKREPSGSAYDDFSSPPKPKRTTPPAPQDFATPPKRNSKEPLASAYEDYASPPKKRTSGKDKDPAPAPEEFVNPPKRTNSKDPVPASSPKEPLASAYEEFTAPPKREPKKKEPSPSAYEDFSTPPKRDLKKSERVTAQVVVRGAGSRAPAPSEYSAALEPSSTAGTQTNFEKEFAASAAKTASAPVKSPKANTDATEKSKASNNWNTRFQAAYAKFRSAANPKERSAAGELLATLQENFLQTAVVCYFCSNLSDIRKNYY